MVGGYTILYVSVSDLKNIGDQPTGTGSDELVHRKLPKLQHIPNRESPPKMILNFDFIPKTKIILP